MGTWQIDLNYRFVMEYSGSNPDGPSEADILDEIERKFPGERDNFDWEQAEELL